MLMDEQASGTLKIVLTAGKRHRASLVIGQSVDSEMIWLPTNQH